MGLNKKIGVFLIISIFLLLPSVFADSYNLDFITAATVYQADSPIELRGLLTNSTNDETIPLENGTININIFDSTTNELISSYELITDENGEFFSQSNFYLEATLVSTPSSEGNYYILAEYTDSDSVEWSAQAYIYVTNLNLDKIKVSTDSSTYSPDDTVNILVEAVKEVGDSITYTSGVVLTATVRDSDNEILETLACTTDETGKCTETISAPTYGEYIIEVNDFAAYTRFEVKRFEVNLWMKDELGESFKYSFSSEEQASVQVNVITSSTSETYTFSGVIKDSSGSAISTIELSSILSNANSYTNTFTLTLDALTFPEGPYYVEVNVTKSTGGTVSAFTSFEVKNWDLIIKKKSTDSGFEYEYSAYPGELLNLELYPTWRSNGSIISDLDMDSINISLLDKFNNELEIANATFNLSCGLNGCYEFSLTSPSDAGKYYIHTSIIYNGETQISKRRINVINLAIFAQTTDKDGNLKELFGANDYVYLQLSAKNLTGDVNLTTAHVISVVYMTGSETTYTEVADFDSVNTTNNDLEWAWDSITQQLKLDTPAAGGTYNVYVSAEDNSAATSVRFNVNPYDVCASPKDSLNLSGVNYVYQFSSEDTVYFELRVTQANNQAGRASAYEGTSAMGYGMGFACMDQSSLKQVVTNATITIENVVNILTGRTIDLDSSSGCLANDNSGGYSCTIQPEDNWEGGSYGVKFNIIGQDGKSDTAYGGFEAREFYLYAYTQNWRNKPDGSINLTIQMYNANSNWWLNYGSAGLNGTVTIEKIEYMGRDGEGIWPPITYDYDLDSLDNVIVTNGQGNISLSPSNAPGGQWQPSYYRAILRGVDSDENVDYGSVWFEVKNWEVYASPVVCDDSGTCSSVYNINSKENLSLYVMINNAGEWGTAGNSLGGPVTISVKKIKDCRQWPCKDLDPEDYSASSITVSESSGWYLSENINNSYLISLNTTTGSWGKGYWQVILNVNNTETGSGWFNTITFYVEVQPTNETGEGWKSAIKNNEPMYFNVKSLKSQKNGWYSTVYNASDYINTTIASANLRRWDTTTFRSLELNYPEDFNISVIGGDGDTINGSVILNITNNDGSWSSGYYWGELTLQDETGDTSTGWLWFEARPFRVGFPSSYSINSNLCVTGNITIAEPDWNSITPLEGIFNLTSVKENIWSGSGNRIITYTNYTPTSFEGSSEFEICPNNGTWGSGSWGDWHYLTLTASDQNGNSGDGWFPFNPFYDPGALG